MTSLPFSIQGQIVDADSGDDYVKAIDRHSHLSILKPKYVVFPAAFSDIPLVLQYATSQEPPLEVAVKGGGAHSSVWASSEGGIVIDLGRLNGVTVAEDKQSVAVQGGALWGHVYKACQEAKVEVVGGPLWYVGVGGFSLGGGYGPMSGEHGLAIDNLLSAVVVLADGRIVKTSLAEEPDLFWAIRGGGSQFGVVVEFTFKAYPPAGPFTVGTLIYPGSEVPQFLKVLQEWKVNQTGQARINVMFFRPGPQFTPKIMVLPWVSGASDAKQVLAPFREGTIHPIVDKVVSVPDMLTVSHAGDAGLAVAPRRVVIRGGLIADIWTDMFLEVWKRWCDYTESTDDVKGSTVFWDITRPDKIAQVDPAATASHVRKPHYWFAIQGRSHEARADQMNREFVSSLVSYIRQVNTEKTGEDFGAFLNMSQGDERPEDVFGENLPRLRKVKAKYDPKKVWSKGIVIEPDFE
ncbi:FAD-binding domain-containing protein [Flammula alnicola]|nr:FAD-binding domain-containing protein [Flammula alnicola]